MTEHEPAHHGPREPGGPDWRRLEVAHARYADRITNGITAAQESGREIEEETARCIAHVLGRALGPHSELAEFGHIGQGSYEALRDEYLTVYNDPAVDPATKEAIDWLGTHLVARENTGFKWRLLSEQDGPKLERLLIETPIDVNGQSLVANFPASLDSRQIDGIVDTLTQLRLDEDEALQAFLSLPDVGAGVDDIMQSFDEASVGTYQSAEHALRVLSPLEDWENQLADWCIDHGIDADALEWNLEPLIERLRTIYDLVQLNGRVHGFAR